MRLRPPTADRRLRPWFAPEPLEDRCVPSSAAGVRQTWPLFSGSQDVAVGAGSVALPGPSPAVLYTGPLLTMPTGETLGRTATLRLDERLLPGTFLDRGDGTTAVASHPLLAVPGNYLIDVRLHAPAGADDVYHLRLSTAPIPGDPFDVAVETSVLAEETGWVSLPSGPADKPQPGSETPFPSTVPPPPATVPPPPVAWTGPPAQEKPPVAGPPAPPPTPPGPPIGFTSPAVVPPSPPAPKPPAEPQRAGPLPAVREAEFRAGWTLAVTTAAAEPPAAPAQTDRPIPADPRLAVAVLPADAVPPAESPSPTDRPASLELVAVRERSRPPADDGLPVLMGVAVADAPPVPAREPDLREMLVRLAAEVPAEAATAEPPADPPPPRRPAWLLLAGLVGVGTGRFVWTRRAARPRPLPAAEGEAG
jgi:hypothetical protein